MAPLKTPYSSFLCFKAPVTLITHHYNGTLGELLHGDFLLTHSFRSLNTTLFMCVALYEYVCVCIFYLCVCLRQRRPMPQSKNEKFVLDFVCVLYTHTQHHPIEGCGEVIQGTAICKSICCLQISFLL